MSVVQLRPSVKRVVVVGEAGPALVYEQKNKKKVSKRNKRAEAQARRFVKANMTAMATYLEEHEKSNRKKKDGWMRDYSWNLGKAMRKGARKYKVFGS